eukprot:217754-Hanusia_phi.AAC.1
MFHREPGDPVRSGPDTVSAALPLGPTVSCLQCPDPLWPGRKEPDSPSETELAAHHHGLSIRVLSPKKILVRKNLNGPRRPTRDR